MSLAALTPTTLALLSALLALLTVLALLSILALLTVLALAVLALVIVVASIVVVASVIVAAAAADSDLNQSVPEPLSHFKLRLCTHSHAVILGTTKNE